MINFQGMLAKFDPESSIQVSDKKIIASLIDDPGFPFLVSFPRTGSHWLRMLMELYFERPALVRVFYFRDSNDFTCYHTHDEDLRVRGRLDVIYLYRDPVDTVYSQLRYDKEDIADPHKIDYWADLYGRHLKKWLYDEDFTIRKTVLRYEGLKEDLANEFGKVVAHFDVDLDNQRLAAIAEQVSKTSLKKKTVHDKQVVNLDPKYGANRESFRAASGGRIRSTVISIDDRLTGCFV